jgi:hypothetical protein
MGSIQALYGDVPGASSSGQFVSVQIYIHEFQRHSG